MQPTRHRHFILFTSNVHFIISCVITSSVKVSVRQNIGRSQLIFALHKVFDEFCTQLTSIASELLDPASLISSNMAAVSLFERSCVMNSFRRGLVSSKNEQGKTSLSIEEIA